MTEKQTNPSDTEISHTEISHASSGVSNYTNGFECYPSAKWIRAYFNGQLIIDSKHAVLLRADGRPPLYYFPRNDVLMEFLSPANAAGTDHGGEKIRYWNLQVGQRRVEKAARDYLQPQHAPSLAGYLTFDWASMDAWFEEQEEVFVHARDPRVRIDTVQSSRHVKVVINTQTVAETRCPVLVFETGLPLRYYIPKSDVRLDLLLDSERVTYCPYKGEAHYYSVRVGDCIMENIAWYYRYPVMESAKIASHIAFYDERLEAFLVDGKPPGPGR